MHIVGALLISTCGWLLLLILGLIFQPLYAMGVIIGSPLIISGGVLVIYAVEALVWIVRQSVLRPVQPREAGQENSEKAQ